MWESAATLALAALAGAPAPRADDPTDALRIWTATFERGRRASDGEREAELRAVPLELRTFSAQGLEQSPGLQLRRLRQPLRHLAPARLERIRSRAPRPWLLQR